MCKQPVTPGTLTQVSSVQLQDSAQVFTIASSVQAPVAAFNAWVPLPCLHNGLEFIPPPCRPLAQSDVKERKRGLDVVLFLLVFWVLKR